MISMRCGTGVLLALLSACGQARLPGAGAEAPADLAFTHVAVVDVESGSILKDQTVLIDGGRIAAVYPTTRIPPWADRVVDASGLHMVPGLWDIHVHTLNQFISNGPLLLANGITGIRHPGGSTLDSLRHVRAQVAQHQGPLPRLLSAGVLIDGSPPVRPAVSAVLTDQARAPALVDSLVAGGADHLKVYARIKREPLMALADEARRRNLPLTGHVPHAVGALGAASTGMRLIDHVFEFPAACSANEQSLRARRVAAEGTNTMRDVRLMNRDTILLTYDRAKCRALARQLAQSGTWVDPTIYLARVFSHWEDASQRDTMHLRYFAPGMRNLPTVSPLVDVSVDTAKSHALYRLYVDIIRVMHAEGVELLAGTDAPSPGLLLGFSLHDELRTLVQDVGLTPLEALRTATLNPARYLAASDSMGTVEVGKVADLVLLRGNPLSDIRNTTQIAGVVANGHYVDRATLDEFLKQAEQAARDSQR